MSISSLAGGGASAQKVAQCALVLEDNPVGADSRLVFESFQQEIEETYAVQPYEELGAKRMPQPGYVSYRGGNWGPFTLLLYFRAGTDAVQAGRPIPDPASALRSPDIETMLIEMERKARWCQALTFPLERALGAAGERILGRARANNIAPSEAATEAIKNLKRNDPPVVLVVFGSWMTIRGYVTQTSLKWMTPWHPVSARPYGCEVTLNIQPQLEEYPTWQTIRNRGGTTGFTTASPTIRGAIVPDAVRQSRLRGQQNAASNAAARAERRQAQIAEGIQDELNAQGGA